MATLTPSRSVFASTCKTVAQQCSRRPVAVQQLVAVPVARQVSSSSAVQQEQDASGSSSSSQQPRPRWSYTPERMKGPGFSLNLVKDPRRKHWLVNSDPEKLDAFYEAFLGQGGSRMLSDETKWLAVTHKSFDYGRRGYNTRLAFLGRQIIALETTRSILTSPVLNEPAADKYGRQPYNHAALANIDKLIHTQPIDIMDKTKIARMGIDLGLLTVLRWKPRMPEDLESSGVVVVLNSTLFAIIGAISLEKGAAVAQRIVREKILKKLGA
ncbi:ribonuclease-III-like-domain-containing protein [Sordaria sp. MPI-SDFR-AT-0083]|nr:ribonuclease-III-like-domain-containing protein [Sordaria sp. MPI-SDFR-AT-0083]